MASPEVINCFKGSWKEWSWHLKRNERMRGVGGGESYIWHVGSDHFQSSYNMSMLRTDAPWNREEIKERKTQHTVAYEETKLLHGPTEVRVWYGYLKCSHICTYVCSNVIANNAPKTFNQGRDSLRKFPSVKYLLIAEAYNEVNENNTLIIDSCCCGEYNSHII